MASFLSLILEGNATILGAMGGRSRQKTVLPSRKTLAQRETPGDRFIKLMNHPEWGPGIMTFVRVNPTLNLPALMKNVRLKPSLQKWMMTGTFRGEEKRNPPKRQEIHDGRLDKYLRKKRLLNMIRGGKNV